MIASARKRNSCSFVYHANLCPLVRMMETKYNWNPEEPTSMYEASISLPTGYRSEWNRVFVYGGAGGQTGTADNPLPASFERRKPSNHSHLNFCDNTCMHNSKCCVSRIIIHKGFEIWSPKEMGRIFCNIFFLTYFQEMYFLVLPVEWSPV